MAASNRKLKHISSKFSVGDQLALNAEQFNLSTMGDRALQAEVIALFESQLASVLKRDRAADGKFQAHTLRGAALSIGAEEIAYIATLWDDLALSPAHVDDALKQAHARFQAAVAAFFQPS